MEAKWLVEKLSWYGEDRVSRKAWKHCPQPHYPVLPVTSQCPFRSEKRSALCCLCGIGPPATCDHRDWGNEVSGLLKFNVRGHTWRVAVTVESAALNSWVSLFSDAQKPSQGSPVAFSVCEAQERSFHDEFIVRQVQNRKSWWVISMMNLGIKDNKLYETYPLLGTSGY